MKHTNSVFKKALSVFLCAVMMLSVISVGIIIPETKITTYAATANSYDTLKTAINNANSAGGTTTIQLTGNIVDSNTSRAALPAITGSVILDLAGYNIGFAYSTTVSGTGGNKSNNSYQLPSENAGVNRGSPNSVLTKAMINVASSGSLKIINTSATASKVSCSTRYQKKDAAGTDDYTLATSSHLLYCEGTLILGDRENSSNNNFTLEASSVVYSSDNSIVCYHAITAQTYASTVTVNNANAKVYMYGGTINAAATSRGQYGGDNKSGCYGLYLAKCSVAEIYNGSINIIKGSDQTGLQCDSGTNIKNTEAYFIALRLDSGTAYVFNTNSDMWVCSQSDTKASKTKTAFFACNIFNVGGTMYVYGFNASRTLDTNHNDNESIDAFSIAGSYNKTESSAYSLPGSAQATNKTDAAVTLTTHFYMPDQNTENGTYPWGADGTGTYAAYIAGGSYKTEPYSASIETAESTQSAATTYSYLRNGYTHSGWLYSKIPGAAGTETDPQAGGIFCYPKWVENTYTITYDLNDTTGNNKASNADGAPATYKITSTSALPTPTRGGYSFGGWLLDSKTVPATDTVTDAWMQGSTYAAGTSLTGKNGNITLKAIWTEVPYTATFDYDNIPAGASGTKTTTTAPYNVNSTFQFPTGCTKDYYTFNNKWKVSTAGGSWQANNTLYAAGDYSASANYGNVTFTAQYTPIDYTITFDSDFGVAVDSMTYNYESTATLPATTRLGYTFAGWKPVELSASGLWDPTVAYPAGTSLNHKHDNITLKAQWESVGSKVNLSLGTGEILDGNTQLDYAYASPLQLNNPTKTGYKFKGWKVTQIPAYTTEPAANRWVIDHEYLLGNETNVTLPANMLGDVTLTPIWEANSYRLTYNTNGAAAIDPKDYKITDSFNLATPTRNGYTFSGWSVNAHDDVYNWTASTYAGGQSISGMYGNVTLLASWTKEGYTVTLDVNGGDALTDNTLDYDIEGTTALPQPTRTGYDFAGWKLTACDASSDWEADAIYTDALPFGHFGSLTLTAQWTHKAYSITLNTSGTNGGDRTYYIDSASFTLGSSELPGYTFKNWKVNATAGNWTKDATYLATDSITAKYGDVSLTAQFEPISYTITYKNEKGVQIGTAQTYTIEDTFALRNYSIDGYTFNGWTVMDFDGGGWNVGNLMAAGDLSANMYYGNVTLMADVTPIEYSLTFLPDGGTSYPAKTYTIETDDFVLPTPTKTGYDFAGWKVTTAAGSWTADAVFAAGTSVAGKYGSATLTATWTPKQYAIKYIVGNTAAYPDGITKEGTFAQTAPDLTDAEKAKPSDAQYDYTFDHWDPALATVNGETTYTAVYTTALRSYDIKWMIPDDVGGTLTNYTENVTPAVNYGTTPVYNGGVNPTLTSDDPDNYSWRFKGWATTAGDEALGSLPTVTGTATYYAVFEKVDNPEEVNWIINGVTNTELWGINETPAWNHDTPTKPDENGYKYVFTGWNPSIVPVEQGRTYTYTAQFTSELQTYTYSFNANGAAETVNGGNYKMGDTIAFPTVTKAGYTFAGWKLDAAVGTWTADTTVTTSDYATGTLWGNVTFTAQWTPVTYTITYNKSTGDDTVPTVQEYNIESTETLGTASREGYTLSGWAVATASGNWTQGTILAPDAVLTGYYGNVTFAPVWQVNTYTITWISGGAEQTSEVEYDSAILAFPPSAKMGYTADWDAEVPATMPAHDLIFNAVYTPVEYYVRVNVNGGSAVENFYYTINGDNTLPTPTRDGATFAGWKVTAAAGNWSKNAVFDGGDSLNGKYGNVSLTAQWNMRTCTVIWNAGDVVKETTWYYGSTPSFDGTPYKSPDEENSYVFTGWDKEIVPVTEDEVTYTAIFKATERVYTVIWNIDGATTTQTYKYGETPVYGGETPVRPETSEYIFTFTGWSPAVDTVTKDVTYIAQFGTFTKIQGLSLDSSSEFLEIDGTVALKATIYPSNATVKDVIWTSSDESVATIDDAGNITAVKDGVALIKVSSVDGAFNSYCVVTVNARKTNYVLISAGNISTTQLPGTSITLTATVMPDNATDTSIEWSSSNNAVATVDSNGLVTFKAVGNATITAKAKDGFAVGSIDVVTTSDETEVEDTVKTYLVSFASVSGGFIVMKDGVEYGPIDNNSFKFEEGSDVIFKLTSNNFYPLVNGVSLGNPGSDGWYRVKTIDRNIAVVDEIIPIGVDVIDPDKEENNAPTFWQRVQNFFKMIVNFFRNLFK